MGELADTVKGTFENGAGASALDICDNSDPASIVFMGRMIEPLSGGHRVVKRESRHGGLIILQREFGARVGILLRDKAFGGIVEYGSLLSCQEPKNSARARLLASWEAWGGGSWDGFKIDLSSSWGECPVGFGGWISPSQAGKN